MPFEVQVASSVLKALRKAPPWVREAFVAALDELAREPRRSRPGFDVKRLAGQSRTYRLRIGQWRALYAVDEPSLVVRVTLLARREEAYR